MERKENGQRNWNSLWFKLDMNQIYEPCLCGTAQSLSPCLTTWDNVTFCLVLQDIHFSKVWLLSSAYEGMVSIKIRQRSYCVMPFSSGKVICDQKVTGLSDDGYYDGNYHERKWIGSIFSEIQFLSFSLELCFTFAHRENVV